MSDNISGASFNYVYCFPTPLETIKFMLKPLEKCLAESLIVLDANVLLLPFKTGPHALDEIEKALEQLKAEKRLFVPDHALREYLANRPEKIKEFYDQLNKRRSKDYSVSSVAKLVEKVNSFEKLQEAEKKLKNEVEEYKKVVDQAIAEVKQWTTNDPVSKMYKKILSEEIVIGLPQDLVELEKEHKERNAKSIPPGYKDSGKSSNNIGDFLIWKTILTVAERNPHKDLIFVTGEEKSDWVYRSSNDVLYAREELIEEYRQASKGGTFHLIDFATLLKYLNASDRVVAEVLVSEAVSTPNVSLLSGSEDSRSWREFSVDSEFAVGEWLSSQFDKVIKNNNDSPPDFRVFSFGKDLEILVEVKAFNSVNDVHRRIRDLRLILSRLIEKQYNNNIFRKNMALAVLVFNSREKALYAAETISNIENPDWFGIQSGYIDGGVFIPV